MRAKEKRRGRAFLACLLACFGLLSGCGEKENAAETGAKRILEYLNQTWPEGLSRDGGPWERLRIGEKTYAYDQQKGAWRETEEPGISELKRRLDALRTGLEIAGFPFSADGGGELADGRFAEDLFRRLREIQRELEALTAETEEWAASLPETGGDNGDGALSRLLAEFERVMAETETLLTETVYRQEEDSRKTAAVLEAWENLGVSLSQAADRLDRLFAGAAEGLAERKALLEELREENSRQSEDIFSLVTRFRQLPGELSGLSERALSALAALKRTLKQTRQEADRVNSEAQAELSGIRTENNDREQAAGEDLERWSGEAEQEQTSLSSEADAALNELADGIAEQGRQNTTLFERLGEETRQAAERLKETLRSGDRSTGELLAEAWEAAQSWQKESVQAREQTQTGLSAAIDGLSGRQKAGEWSLAGNYWVQNGVSQWRATGFSAFEHATGLTDDSGNGVSETEQAQREWMGGFDGFIRWKNSGQAGGRPSYLLSLTDYGLHAAQTGETLDQYGAGWRGEQGDAGENGLSIGAVLPEADFLALEQRAAEKYGMEAEAFAALFRKPSEKSENVPKLCPVLRTLISSEEKISYQMTDIYGSVRHLGCIHDTYWADGRTELDQVVDCNLSPSFVCGTADTPGCTNPVEHKKDRTADHTGRATFSLYSGYPHTPQNLIYRGQCKCGVFIPDQPIQYKRTESQKITTTINRYSYYYFHPVTGQQVNATEYQYLTGGVTVMVPQSYAELDDLSVRQTEKLKSAGFLNAAGRVSNVNASRNQWVYVGREDGESWKWYGDLPENKG